MANPSLKPKHYKALELWEEGILSIKEIAAACGIPLDQMYDMFEGDATGIGGIAHLFKAELDKITVRSAQKIKVLIKDNKKIALEMINNRLKELKKNDLTKETSAEVVKLTNTLSKVTPKVEIGSYNALSFTKGMTPEELVYEFRRLSAIARNPSLGGGVPGASGGAKRGVPGLTEPGSAAEEK